jgi:hypothetical protein
MSLRLFRCWVDSAWLRAQGTLKNVPVLQEVGLEGEVE